MDRDTGQVDTVVAVAATGRTMARVTGGTWGWVYTTTGATDVTYLRYPSEARGTPLAGLAPTAVITAQP